MSRSNIRRGNFITYWNDSVISGGFTCCSECDEPSYPKILSKYITMNKEMGYIARIDDRINETMYYMLVFICTFLPLKDSSEE